MSLLKQPAGKDGRAVWTGDGIKVVKHDGIATVYREGEDPEQITAEEADELIAAGTGGSVEVEPEPETCDHVQRNGEVCGRKLPCRLFGHR